MTENCRDYEKELQQAWDRITDLESELEDKTDALYRTEGRFRELEQVIHHQSIVLKAYKDVTFKLEKELSK